MNKKENKKQLVLKIGSSTIERLGVEKIVKEVVEIIKMGYSLVLVSSGAASEGRKILKNISLDLDKFSKKELAAIGQGELYQKYTKLFREQEIQTAQILITGEVWSGTIENLLKHKILVIANGNDPDEARDLFYEDNDTLAGDILLTLKEGRLILLTDIDGVYDRNPRENGAKKIRFLNKIDKKLLEQSKTKGESGTGGMYTKLLTAQKLLENNLETYITNSFDDLKKFLNNGEWEGTVVK